MKKLCLLQEATRHLVEYYSSMEAFRHSASERAGPSDSRRQHLSSTQRPRHQTLHWQRFTKSLKPLQRCKFLLRFQRSFSRQVEVLADIFQL